VLNAPDPWKGREPAAAARGRKLYHVVAQCLGCHPAYASRADIDAASREAAAIRIREICDKLLANPVIEDYRFEIATE